MRIDIQNNKSNECLNKIGQALPNFFLKLPERLQNCIESHIKRSTKADDETNSAIPIRRNDKTKALEVNLEKQLQAWKENPSWTDQSPFIKVSIPKGSLCNLSVEVDVGLPPDAVYNIVTDPDGRRVFKNIKETISRKVLADDGSRQLVEVEQAALWRFLWWSGTISVHVLVDQNSDDRTMKFTQLKTGFMKKFEGNWKVEPLFVDEELCHPFKPRNSADYFSCTRGKGRIGSRVTLEQLIQPAIVPPPPISWYLRGITTKTSEMLINDLFAEAARIRGGCNAKYSEEEHIPSQEESDERGIEELCDIKKRWALQRKHGRRGHRRLG